MKITKTQLKQIIKEEFEIFEAEEGAEIMKAIQDVPSAAQSIADGVRKEIEAITQGSGLGPEALASIVAELIQADY
tara:strand:+ start:1091 stop:1318 length:228 start_codon:yes stop_codon:yes gene_type:complete